MTRPVKICKQCEKVIEAREPCYTINYCPIDKKYGVRRQKILESYHTKCYKNLTKYNNDFKKDLEIKKLKEDLTASQKRERHGANAG